jgi:hypothetical protein
MHTAAAPESHRSISEFGVLYAEIDGQSERMQHLLEMIMRDRARWFAAGFGVGILLSLLADQLWR